MQNQYGQTIGPMALRSNATDLRIADLKLEKPVGSNMAPGGAHP